MAKTPTPKVITKKHLARLERENIQNRYITIIAAVVLVLVVGLVGFGVLDQTVLKGNKAVAQVGKERITINQFETQVRFTREQLIRQYQSTVQLAQLFGNDPNNQSYFTQQLQQIQSQLDPSSSATLGESVLNRMINDRIVRQEAAKRGITVTKEEVDEAMQADFGYFPNGTPTPEATPTVGATSTLSPTQMALLPPTSVPTTEPTSAVTPTAEPATPTVEPTAAGPTPTAGPTGTPEPTATPYTFEGYQTRVKDTLKEMESLGFTEADLRYLEESNIYYRKLQEAITADVKPEEEQVWARHILVKDEATAQSVIERLKNGEDFAKLAAELSQDPSNKDTGGDLGWFGRGKMLPEFENAVFSLQIGEISQPVQTTYGWHVIQVLGHEVRPLSAQEFQSLKDQKFSTWLDEASKADNVKKFDVWKTVVPTEPALTAQ